MSSSITQWLAALRRGDAAAAERLWKVYFQQLVRLARRNLHHNIRAQTFDEEDVASSVLGDFILRYQNGNHADIQNRDELWQLLVIITNRRSISLVRQEQTRKRGKGRVLIESELSRDGDFRLDHLLGKDLVASFSELMSEQCWMLLESLGDPTLEKITLWKLEGHTNEEVAAKLGCTRITIQRKLRLIRNIWSSELLGLPGKGGVADDQVGDR